MKRVDMITKAWSDYGLIDSGDGRKLERFGSLLLDRPDPQALWHKSQPERWADASAQFLWTDKGQPTPSRGGFTGERWTLAKGTPESWDISWRTLAMRLSFKGFKHVGIFPEHAHQWDLLHTTGKKNHDLRMLNLFGYTGAASIAAAQVGMKVTHVDASKQTVAIVKENAALSGVDAQAMRTVIEDALIYARRLITRGEQFEVIVMDPPAFGRGPKGEVWKIEESLAELMAFLPKLISPDACLVIVNGYAAGYSARTFGELLHEVMPHGIVSYGDVGIAQEDTERVLSTGIYAKWER